MDRENTLAHHRLLDDSFAERLSRELKRVRQARSMTLNALATAVGCSESLLSKFENGKHFPSLPMVGRIAQALDVPMSTLLDGLRDVEPVICRCEPQSGRSPLEICADGMSLAAAAGRVTPLCDVLRFDPGEASIIEAHEAGDETGIVLEGQPNLIIDGCTHLLDVGDAFAFRAEQAHGYTNPGSTQARIFRVYARSIGSL